MTNDVRLSPFSLFCGTRQGCLLSPLLVDLALEPLAHAIRQASQVEGIQIAGGEYTLALYAADALLFPSDPDTSVPSLMDSTDYFGCLLNYKINWRKSEALYSFH